MNNSPSKLTPALFGGSAIGLLSSIPIIKTGNCLCCMWIFLGGALGAYLYGRELPHNVEFRSGDAASVGFLAGIFGALFGTLLNYLIIATVGFNADQNWIQSLLRMTDSLPSELEDLLKELKQTSALDPFFVTMELIFNLIVYSLFGMVGGILTSVYIKKKSTKTKRRSAGKPGRNS